jgi:LPXTG-site transpeptidase (sortase) family protein
MSQDSAVQRPGISARVVTLRALGNLFLGMAIGLAVYYGLTDVATSLQQAALQDDLGAAGGAEAPTDFVDSQDPFDMTGWEEQDKAYWDSLAEGEVFGRLVITRIGLDVAVVKGHTRASLKKGPGWIDYTDLPNTTGNVGIAGHRTTYGGPFRRLNELKLGDTIDLYSPYRRYRYAVFGSESVTPDQTEVMDSTTEPRLTLSACDPPYSARYRLITSAELVDVSRMVDSVSETVE